MPQVVMLVYLLLYCRGDESSFCDLWGAPSGWLRKSKRRPRSECAADSGGSNA